MKKILALFIMGLLIVSNVTPVLAAVKRSNKRRVTYKSYVQAPDGILKQIDKYQKQYFSIIKRNDMFLQLANYDGRERDNYDLANLFRAVKQNIGGNYFLDKYETIERTYAENPGETTYDIAQFNNLHREAVDSLLNEVYKAVKNRISADKFQNVKISQQNWLKDVAAYKKVIDAQDFGTIGGSVFAECQISMKNFRTLLLMLYL